MLTPVEPIRSLQVDELPINVYASNTALGQAAALDAHVLLTQAISTNGEARLILATGNSQLTFLHALRVLDGIDWAKVTIFHMDEYIGIDPTHRASFPLFLRQHLIDAIQPRAFHAISSNAENVDQISRAYERLLRERPIDVVALGIGENGHIAFNDPPYADFDDPVWVKVITLAEASRQQQLGEGHFDTLAEVPTQAITLTIPALLAARRMLVIVPETRKANAVHACLTQPISPDRPGSILRRAPHARLYLDTESSAKLLGQA